MFHQNSFTPDNPIILVFTTEGRCLTAMASSLMGVPNTKGEKIEQFLTSKSVYEETVRDTAIVTKEVK